CEQAAKHLTVGGGGQFDVGGSCQRQSRPAHAVAGVVLKLHQDHQHRAAGEADWRLEFKCGGVVLADLRVDGPAGRDGIGVNRSASIGGLVPVTSTLPSSCLVMVAPPCDCIAVMSGISQPAPGAFFRVFSHAANWDGSCSFSNFSSAAVIG